MQRIISWLLRILRTLGVFFVGTRSFLNVVLFSAVEELKSTIFPLCGNANICEFRIFHRIISNLIGI